MSQSEKDKINFENNNKKLKEAGLILLGKKSRGKQRYLCSKCNTTFYSKRNRSIKISKNKKHQYKISAFSTTIHTNDDKYESNISNNYENYLNGFINK